MLLACYLCDVVDDVDVIVNRLWKFLLVVSMVRVLPTAFFIGIGTFACLRRGPTRHEAHIGQ